VKGGIGTAAIHRGPLVVGAIVALNAVGEILAEGGRPIAANRAPADADQRLWRGTNTTLVVVATNGRLTALGCRRLAAAAHDGVARAVRPAHTLWDGDTAFALATGEVEASPTEAEGPAADAVTIAIRRAVRLAEGIGGIPSVGPSEGE
jgi:L-aminopeptidase/D-esterase-like protein